MISKIKNKERQGEVYIGLEVLLWSLFPVITILSYSGVTPLISLGWSTLFAAIFFGIILTFKKKWHELHDKTALKDILLVSVFIGVGFYSFYYFGLTLTTAGNASIIALSEVLFTFIFFQLWKKETLPQSHIFGAILLVIGAFIVLFPNASSLNLGDILIVLAVSTAPFGNFFQRRARKRVSSYTIMFGRSALSTIFIFIFAYLLGERSSVLSVQQSLLFLVVNGVLLLGLSKILWLEGIHRISVTKAIALNSAGPLLTLVFAWMLLGEIPTMWQLAAFVPMFAGVLLLSKGKS